MKNLKIYFALLVTILNINFTLSQDFTPPTTYFETSSVPISIFGPPSGEGSGVVSYFDLSQINTDKPDIAIPENTQQLILFPTYQFKKYGNWNSNLGSGNFSTQSGSPFFPFESFYGEQDINRFTAANFIKLRNTVKKDFVGLRESNIYVFQNESGTLSNAVQNISNGGTYMSVGSFTSGDNNDDVGIANPSGVIKIYRNDLTGTLSLLNPSPDVPAKKLKIGQINDKTFPYPQIDPNNRADIVTITNNSQYFNIYQNNNNNGVNSPLTIDAGFIINDLEVADINRDGYNDVIVLGGSTVVKIFLNNGSGVINNTPVYTNSFPGSINPLLAISDLNNDGYNDLVVVRNEGQTSVFINTGSGSYFSLTPDQFIPNLVGLQSINTQIKVLDIYNQGGKALFISWSGTGPVGLSNWGVSRVNAICFNWPPPPPLVAGSTQQVGSFIRPKIRILSNFETLDFLKYEIYKSKASTGWTFVYCGETTATEYIDNTEYVLVSGDGDAPPPNCYYAVKTVDQSSPSLRSNLSNQLGYRVGIPVCPNCAVGDNSFVSPEQSIESQIEAPVKYNLTNFPNPFNPTTKIYYSIPLPGNVKIEIYNSNGQKIKELLNEFKYIGNYVTEFDGSDYSSGVYFYKIETGNFIQTKRMVLIK